MTNILERVKEPTTWASVAVLLGVFGVDVTDSAAFDSAVKAVVAVTGLAGVLLAERGSSAAERGGK